MNIPMTQEERHDFASLIREAIEAVESENGAEAQRALSEFSSTAFMLSLEALGQAGNEFKDFFARNVLPHWDSKAANTLVYCMEETAGGLQSPDYETSLIPLLHEVTLYLQKFPLEDTGSAREGSATAPQPCALSPSEPSSAPGQHNEQASGTFMNDPDFLRALLQVDPTSGAFVRLAEQLCRAREWREAIETCRRGLFHHPHSVQGQILLGWALWEAGERGEAEETLGQAQKQFERGAVLYKVLGEIWEKKGDGEKALSCFSLYEKLQGPNTREPKAPEPGNKGQEAGARGEGQETGAEAPQILSELMNRFEKAGRSPGKESFRFSMEDRESLKKILRKAATKNMKKEK